MEYVVSVAQLDRVSASDAEGCGFDPRRIRHKKSCLYGGFFYGIKNRGVKKCICFANRKKNRKRSVSKHKNFSLET